MSFTFLLLLAVNHLAKSAESDEICYECHGEKDFVIEEDGKKASLYVSEHAFNNSVHAEEGCVSCHWDVDPEELPHDEDLAKVECDMCHGDAAEKFEESLHGQALEQGKYLAPNCITCHGKHNILPSSNEKSKTYVMNIPKLCGDCHKEGTPVSQLREVSKTKALENYSQSIHGEGLYKQGLIVTAVCTDCHTSHNILPHENPKSSINHDNIANTCMKCHAQIESVHKKVIRGELWEKKPHEIPVCVDCHQPHKIRRVFYERSFPDKFCMDCHSDKNLTRIENGKEESLFVNPDKIAGSVHGGTSCIKCHTNISSSRDPVCLHSGRVDCSMCHSEEQADYFRSSHGKEHSQGNEDAPYCTDCHGDHGMMAKINMNSPTFARNIPNLCGDCHSSGEGVAHTLKGEKKKVVKNYEMSIHGKGLLESGLMVTATCIDCHTSHMELPEDDPNSSVHEDNVAQTCAECHLGIFEQFRKSIHSPEVSDTNKELPVCNDCHLSHVTKRTDVNKFRQNIIDQCGKCHEDVTESYFDTFHGKVSKLGSAKTARCHDCHGAHNILPPENINSTLSRQNIVETCKKCHENSNRKFVGYLTHATHHDKDKYPFLFYTFWFMTILLISTFGFFGIHTLMWLPRSMLEKRKLSKMKKQAAQSKEQEISDEDTEETEGETGIEDKSGESTDSDDESTDDSVDRNENNEDNKNE